MKVFRVAFGQLYKVKLSHLADICISTHVLSEEYLLTIPCLGLKHACTKVLNFSILCYISFFVLCRFLIILEQCSPSLGLEIYLLAVSRCNPKLTHQRQINQSTWLACLIRAGTQLCRRVDISNRGEHYYRSHVPK